MAKVTLSGINKWYGGTVHAVQDISFEIADGEFFGLLGPSGSGKTSVLRMLAGLEKPTSGTIAFDGAAVERQTPQARNVAMVFEQNALYPHMTARQNISYPLRIRGLPRAEIIGLYLHGQALNLIQAAVRFMPLGQAEGQRILASLAPVILRLAALATEAGEDDLGGCAIGADMAQARHETMTVRIFRT